jgi:hypothetical protein
LSFPCVKSTLEVSQPSDLALLVLLLFGRDGRYGSDGRCGGGDSGDVSGCGVALAVHSRGERVEGERKAQRGKEEGKLYSRPLLRARGNNAADERVH